MTLHKALIVWVMLNVTYVSRYLKHCPHGHSSMAEKEHGPENRLRDECMCASRW